MNGRLDHQAALVAVLDRYPALAVAASGGVDSMVLAYVAHRFSRRGDRIIPPEQVCAMETGAPVLTAAVASLDCRLRLRQPMGDHEVIYGDVVAYRGDPGVDALGFFRGRFVTLSLGEQGES